MASRNKKKDINIFDLYKKEKKIVFNDDDKNEVIIIMVKITQDERRELITEYMRILADKKDEYADKDKKTKYYTKALDVYSKEQLISGIVEYETGERKQLSDLYPNANEEKIKEEDRKKAEEELFIKWEKERKKELNKKDVEAIREELREKVISGLATLECAQIFDFMHLSICCFYDNGKKVFDKHEDVGKLTEKDIVDKLIEELNEFRKVNTSKDVRALVESSSFLGVGESREK